jgi:hypothetical protein
MTHKSEDYKISAVKYYLKNKDNIRQTYKIFNCKKYVALIQTYWASIIGHSYVVMLLCC